MNRNRKIINQRIAQLDRIDAESRFYGSSLKTVERAQAERERTKRDRRLREHARLRDEVEADAEAERVADRLNLRA